MMYIKLQIGSLVVVSYIGLLYLRERMRYPQRKAPGIFGGLLVLGILTILFDGATAWTVNHLDTVPSLVNRLLHLGFLMCLDAMVFLLFLYMLYITDALPRTLWGRFLLHLPLVGNLAVLIAFIPSLEYRVGETTNYSMGVSAYTCYVMLAIYATVSMVIFLRKFRYIESRKRINGITYFAVILTVAVWQSVNPEALVTSLVPPIAVLGAYMNEEDPTFIRLDQYLHEMIMGFATLVENKDGSTGGHIRRTTAYVRLLAEELRRRGLYRDMLTRDYMRCLERAAPMHDIGKIAIPDSILQKPGRLTEEEYTTMKSHAERGGEIVRETFGHLGEKQYEAIAYEVARHHHEKWNGTGYPDGLSRKDIPLCARIMAIADVFDAVSSKRCYRDAMALDDCFNIILEGSGRDFDPVLADIFLESRDKVEAIYGIDTK